jgi:hypothetical protein
MHYFYRLIILIISITGTIFGQIQIQKQDIPQVPGTEYHYLTYEDTTDSFTIQIDVGMEGGGNTWNFSTAFTADTVYSEILKVVDRAHALSIDSFPNANLYWEIMVDSLPPIYLYSILTDTGLVSLGGAVEQQGEVYTFKDSDFFLVFKFPMSYQDAFTNTRADTISTVNGEMITLTTEYDTVDAYGTIQLPGGNYNCIRVLTTEEEITIFTMSGQEIYRDTTNYYTYSWLVPGIFLAATADVEMVQGKTGTVMLASFVEIFNNKVVGIDGIGDITLATSPVLYQNYPNPFNPVTTISFELKQSGNIELTLYNSAGQKIQTLASGFFSNGLHQFQFSAEHLPSGTYFYQLKTSYGNQTRKMILLK